MFFQVACLQQAWTSCHMIYFLIGWVFIFSSITGWKALFPSVGWHLVTMVVTPWTVFVLISTRLLLCLVLGCSFTFMINTVLVTVHGYCSYRNLWLWSTNQICWETDGSRSWCFLFQSPNFVLLLLLHFFFRNLLLNLLVLVATLPVLNILLLEEYFSE